MVSFGPMDVEKVFGIVRRPQRTRKRKPSLVNAVTQAKAAGLDVAGATIALDGSIAMTFGQPPTPGADETKPKKINRWDEVLKRDPPQIAIVKR